MKKILPLFCIVLTLVIALHSPRSPAQIQPAALQDFQPPQLLTPENGSMVKGAPEFFWTSAVLPKGFKGSYRLKVVPINQGQDPKAALGGNSPVHQATMRRTGAAYPADGPALKDGQTYAWGVQVVDANGVPVHGEQELSDVFVFTFGGYETPPPAQGLNITTQPLVMTGMRVGSLTINTQPLVMTGMRVASITIDTQPLVMTGMRIQSITVNTQPLVMTGMRTESITLTTQPLVMTGMRDEQPPPPVDPIKAKVQDELKKKLEQPKRKKETDNGGTDSSQPPEVKEAKQKLDLPFKKPEPVEGAEPPAGRPDEAQMQQSGTGKIPSLRTSSVHEKTAEGNVKDR